MIPVSAVMVLGVNLVNAAIVAAVIGVAYAMGKEPVSNSSVGNVAITAFLLAVFLGVFIGLVAVL